MAALVNVLKVAIEGGILHHKMDQVLLGEMCEAARHLNVGQLKLAPGSKCPYAHYVMAASSKCT